MPVKVVVTTKSTVENEERCTIWVTIAWWNRREFSHTHNVEWPSIARTLSVVAGDPTYSSVEVCLHLQLVLDLNPRNWFVFLLVVREPGTWDVDSLHPWSQILCFRSESPVIKLLMWVTFHRAVETPNGEWVHCSSGFRVSKASHLPMKLKTFWKGDFFALLFSFFITMTFSRFCWWQHLSDDWWPHCSGCTWECTSRLPVNVNSV